MLRTEQVYVRRERIVEGITLKEFSTAFNKAVLEGYKEFKPIVQSTGYGTIRFSTVGVKDLSKLSACELHSKIRRTITRVRKQLKPLYEELGWSDIIYTHEDVVDMVSHINMRLESVRSVMVRPMTVNELQQDIARVLFVKSIVCIALTNIYDSQTREHREHYDAIRRVNKLLHEILTQMLLLPISTDTKGEKSLVSGFAKLLTTECRMKLYEHATSFIIEKEETFNARYTMIRNLVGRHILHLMDAPISADDTGEE